METYRISFIRSALNGKVESHSFTLEASSMEQIHEAIEDLRKDEKDGARIHKISVYKAGGKEADEPLFTVYGKGQIDKEVPKLPAPEDKGKSKGSGSKSVPPVKWWENPAFERVEISVTRCTYKAKEEVKGNADAT